MRFVIWMGKFVKRVKKDGMKSTIHTLLYRIHLASVKYGNRFRMKIKTKFSCTDYEDKLTAYIDDCRNSGNSPRQISAKLIWWNLKMLLKRYPKQNKKDNIIKVGQNRTRRTVLIAIVPEGGYGDYLIFANWLQYFLDKYQNSNILIDVYCHKENAMSIFNYDISHLNVIFGREYPSSWNYDLVLAFNRFPEILHIHKKKIMQKSPEIYEYSLKCALFQTENQHFFEQKPQHDGWSAAVGVMNNIKRIQQPDVFGLLGITEEYRYQLKLLEDETTYLKDLHLMSKEFITVHRGWDGENKKNVKAWSLSSCGNLVQALKTAFPDKKIVVFGSNRNQAPDTTGADLDLVEQTTLEQVKVLLKHAAVHIDNEGGMVHLRHAVHGGASVVMFGPTSPEFFGYSQNKNIRSDVCPQWCEWLTDAWPTKCATIGELQGAAPCMDGICTFEIIEATRDILLRFKDGTVTE